MRIIKGIISLILALALLFTAGLAMGLNAAKDAMSAESIQRAMTDTAIVEELVGDVLADSLTGIDGAYDAITQDIINSDALTEYLSGYLAASLGAEIYGEESGALFNEEELYNDLINSFSQDLEGLIDLEGIEGLEGLTGLQSEDYIAQALESELPEIKAQLDEQINGYGDIGEETFIVSFFMNDEIQAMMAKGFITLLTAISVILGIAVIALGWRGKLGFLWCTIVMGLLSILYVTLSLMGEMLGAIMGVSDGEAMLLTMLTEGFGSSAKTGFIITAVLLIAFIILKITDKRRVTI